MDCERFLSGPLGQPANALSSLAFVVAALWIVVVALRGERAGRSMMIVFALAVAANGIGSFALHGPDPGWARWAHDAAIMSVLLFVGTRALGRSRAWRPTVEMGAYAAALIVVGLGLALVRGASDPFAGTLAAVAVVGEVATGRARERSLARAIGLTAIVLGGVAFYLGRTGSPFCRPESLFQWHALWHVLAAVALAAYAWVAFDRSSTVPAANA